MSTFVSVNTYTHSVTYVADNMLRSLKEIIRESGLSPEKLANEWAVLQRGISKWLETRHLEKVVLEVYAPGDGSLVGRWDFEISYGAQGDGSMWVNTEDIKYHIRKAGQWPSTCDYVVITTTKTGRPDVTGWTSASFRSTEGFVRQAIGTTIDGNGLSSGTAYWRRAQ